jgi:predicted DCC family thiol-disulfide oxidoreductase YuxK
MKNEGNLVAKKPVVVYDGYCNFCSGAVKFLKNIDRKELFEFVPFHDLSSHKEFNKLTLPVDPNESLVVFDIERNSMYYSNAIMYVIKSIGGRWLVLYYLVRLVPKPIRDFLYIGFAKRRYLIFGRRSECNIPTK